MFHMIVLVIKLVRFLAPSYTSSVQKQLFLFFFSWSQGCLFVEVLPCLLTQRYSMIISISIKCYDQAIRNYIFLLNIICRCLCITLIQLLFGSFNFSSILISCFAALSCWDKSWPSNDLSALISFIRNHFWDGWFTVIIFVILTVFLTQSLESVVHLCCSEYLKCRPVYVGCSNSSEFLRIRHGCTTVFGES